MSYSHLSNTTFSVGQDTMVNVTGTLVNTNTTFQCTFNVKILDLEPPNIKCPGNI